LAAVVGGLGAAALIALAATWYFTSAPNPVSVFMTATALDGYTVTHDPAFPAGDPPGPVLPEGAIVDLVLQASDPGRIAEIEGIAIQVQRLGPAFADLQYTVRRQSGYGQAAANNFKVTVGDSGSTLYWDPPCENSRPTDAACQPEERRLDNILLKSGAHVTADNPVFTIDQRGPQETFRFYIRSGIVEAVKLYLIARVVTQGKEYVLQTAPLYIVHRAG
jgi:hypothetical protein